MPGDRLFSKATAALDGGCRLIQYRSKHDSVAQKIKNAARLKKICESYHATLIINDDIEIAETVSAHGVHLGQNDTSLSVARNSLGEHAIIGATCHDSIQLAVSAFQNGANYLAFGRFFPSQTKPTAKAATTDILKTAKKLIPLPIVAICGIHIDNAKLLIDAGADCLAICNNIFDFNDIKDTEKQVRRYLSLFEFSPSKNQDQQ